jgi:O-antigen ligase
MRTRDWLREGAYSLGPAFKSGIALIPIALGYVFVSKGVNYLDQSRDIDKVSIFVFLVLTSLLFASGRKRTVYVPWSLLSLIFAMFVSLALSPFPIIERVNFTNHSNGSFTAHLVIFLAVLTLFYSTSLREIHLGMVLAGVAILILVCVEIIMEPASAFFNKLRIDGSDLDALRGPFEGGNVLAITLAPCLVAALTYNPSTRSRKVLVWAAAVLETIAIVWSSSVTIVITTGLLYVSLVVLTLIKHRRTLIAFMILFASAAMAMILVFFQGLPSFIRENSTLSGRTKIWESVFEVGRENLWFGIGWQTKIFKHNDYWLDLTNDGEIYFRHAHSDLLHWFLVTGIAGLAALVASILIAAIKSALHYRRDPNNTESLWVLLTCLYFAVAGITEVVTVYPYQWFALCVIVLASYNLQKPTNLPLDLINRKRGSY